ncbi:hypothetical protein [Salinibacterium sp. ZJ77]|uniref:hypothetical protein n=1 Tax=Salinibacterium sp. ZJ77 TaxID=2708337 RepID=UPI0014223B85|nr:hypothetical protein [Salinibacterium sp. ZJ77]
MKKTTTLLTAGALATFAAVAIASPAAAATPVGDAVFYTDSDFTNESGPYPTDAWFWGAVSTSSYPGGTGTVSSSGTGLNISNSATQAAQPLTTRVAQPATADEFVGAVQDISVHASNSDWTLQLPVFGEPGEADQQFTTLRPAASGNVDSSTLWQTSRAFGPFTANETATLDAFAAELYEGVTPQVLAAGLFVSPSAATSIYAFEAFGETSVFTPIPTRTITPNPVTLAAAKSTGITFSGTGWFPGTVVYIGVHECLDGDEEPGEDSLSFEDTSNVADENGTFSITVTLPEDWTTGTYCVLLDDDYTLYNLGVQPQLIDYLSIVDTIPAATTPQLAATGAEGAEAGIAIAAIAGLAGLGAVVIAARRRAANA